MIHLFTAFDLQPMPGQILKRHSFEFARRNIKESKVVNEVYYFGAKYSEAGIMTLYDEMNFLEKIFDYYEGANLQVVYVPHRDDSCFKLKIISERFGVSIKRLGCAAELYFSISDYRPSRISAAYSSVLNNLRHFWGGEACDSFVIPESMLNDDYKHAIRDVYSYYQSVGINLIQVEK
ncbi:UDP-glucose:glucosyl LPS a 1,2-glucosyltransferase [Alcanivorax venustensis ISO4]|uniref:UDP-glucose:glucosyl LPS a 1,2-glucosyltransferase n=2 Tax=Alloalcanivorax venustensis TaxID=172371 RepID=A0ABS0AF40_9GAMM|nr:UDP-glucose:glucosyl LPS a 1,2-glucosyltransferase [Alloalcanivorax venustensis ISO4]